MLDITIAPARIPDVARSEATSLATAHRRGARLPRRARRRDVRASDGKLLVNEIAPRPHNSGHYTIDACRTSQFEQQVRVLCGLPLGDPRSTRRR